MRIQIICPCANETQTCAASEVVAALLAEENVQRWGGLTCSGVLDSSFLGAFWNPLALDWELERIALILIDAVGEAEQVCRQYAVSLHPLVERIYARHRQPQRRLWITVHPVAIVASGAPSQRA